MLLWFAIGSGGAIGWPALTIALIALFLSVPHYGATLLRVYEHGADRRRYSFFAVHLTVILAVLLVAGSYDTWVGSALVTLYVTLSPWHFAGQNYGVGLMFLRRRGVPISPLAKRVFYVSFILSFVLAFLSIHVEHASAIYAAGAPRGTDRYSVLRLGLPLGLVRILAPLVGACYLGAIGWAGVLLARRASLRDLLPAAALVLTQALWFVVPAVLYISGAYSGQLLPFAAIWISGAHSVQYLWVTTYYAKRADASTRTVPYLGRTLLAGALVTVVPGLLLAPAVFGATPFHAGLAAVLFSVVNLHHFALDGAVWKLRDGAVAQALLRTGPPAAAEAIGPARRGALRPLVWGAGTLALVLTLWEIGERNFTMTGSSAQPDQVRAALDRLRWAGRDSAGDRLTLAAVYLKRGDPQGAQEQLQRSLDIYPSSAAWHGLGDLYAEASEWDAALAAYRSALELAPNDVKASYASAAALLQLEKRAARASAHTETEAVREYRREAIAELEHAVELTPGHVKTLRNLALAYQRDGRTAEAVALLESSLPNVRPARRSSVEALLEQLRSGAEVGPIEES